LLPILSLLGCGQFMAQKPFHYIQDFQVVALDTTTLNDVEKFGLDQFQINLGNEGTPVFSLIMDAEYAIRGDYSYLSFQKKYNHRQYNVYKPVTHASYIAGSKLEQHFNIYHTQNFNRKSNFSIGFDKVNSPGYYLNQSTNNSHFYVNAYGRDLGKVGYNFELNIDYSNLLSSLNGGIVNDSDFVNDANDLRNRELFEVNLQNASQQLKKWQIDYSHAINLAKKLDTTNNYGHQLSLVHDMGYVLQDRDYYDSILNIDFYNFIYDDSTLTNDKVSYQQLSSSLGVKFEQQGVSRSKAFLGVRPSVNWYNQGAVDTSVVDFDALLDFNWTRKQVYAGAQVEYLINDAYTDNDFDFKSEIGYHWRGHHQFKIYSHIHRDRVALDLQNYEANNVRWNNDFQKQSLFQYGFGYSHIDKWTKELTFNYFDVKNPFYFGYDAKPSQVIGYGQVLQTKLKLEGKLGERWLTSFSGVYQNIGGYDVFMMPNFVGELSAAYNFKMFKKKLDLSIGLNFTYFSKYVSKDFDPISGQFFIATDQEVGGYPYADVVLKGRIQRATFFVMSSHPHQGLLGYNYFLMPHYPAMDRVIRIGVAWMFVN
jgi:hypothetical protein